MALDSIRDIDMDLLASFHYPLDVKLTRWLKPIHQAITVKNVIRYSYPRKSEELSVVQRLAGRQQAPGRRIDDSDDADRGAY